MDIKNKNLARSLMIILSKNVSEMTEDDLSKIEVVTTSLIDEKTGERAYDLEDLKKLPNLKRLAIVNSLLLGTDLGLIGSLPCESVYFEKCIFQEDEYLAQLSGKKRIEFAIPFIRSYDFLKSLGSLEELSIDTPYGNKTVPVDNITGATNLKRLRLHSCKTSKIDSLQALAPSLEVISLMNTSIDSANFLDSLRDGTLVFLEHEYNSNSIVQKNSTRLNIKNDLFEYAFDDDEEVSKKI